LNPKGGGSRNSCILARFDCDLSLDYHYPEFNKNNVRLPADMFFHFGVDAKTKKELEKRDARASYTIIE